MIFVLVPLRWRVRGGGSPVFVPADVWSYFFSAPEEPAAFLSTEPFMLSEPIPDAPPAQAETEAVMVLSLPEESVFVSTPEESVFVGGDG